MTTGTAAQDAAGRRDAARALLQQPILTAARDPDVFALVRRHAKALKSMFADHLGYPLHVGADHARLVKAAPDPAGPPRPVRRTTGAEFGAAGYTYLALVCAALLAPGLGERVPLPMLVEQVRADAAAHGIRVPDAVSERRLLLAALQVLVDWGVLAETGLPDARPGADTEVVLTVHRGLLGHLTAGPLDRAPDRTAAAEPRDSARRRLYRRLVEDPVVARADLDPAARDVLARDRAALARQLEEDFGLVLEVRTEGALAYDPHGALTDEPFPGAGTVRHAALLLISVVLDDAEPAAGDPLPVDTATVDRVLTDLAAAHAGRWRGEHVREVTALRREVTALLVRLGLARSTDDGILLAAAAARYRPSRRSEGTGP